MCVNWKTRIMILKLMNSCAKKLACFSAISIVLWIKASSAIHTHWNWKVKCIQTKLNVNFVSNYIIWRKNFANSILIFKKWNAYDVQVFIWRYLFLLRTRACANGIYQYLKNAVKNCRTRKPTTLGYRRLKSPVLSQPIKGMCIMYVQNKKTQMSSE